MSLPIEPTTAQSARAYLKAEKLETPKSKVKSRPEQGPLEPIPEKQGIFSKFAKSKSKEEPEADQKDSKPSLFSRLSKKTTGYMSQLLGSSKDEIQGPGSMKWDNFVKVRDASSSAGIADALCSHDRSCVKWGLHPTPAQLGLVSASTHPTNGIRCACNVTCVCELLLSISAL
jgi:hypothetical protein